MPLTSYITEDDRKQQKTNANVNSLSLTTEKGKCLQSKVKKALEDHNYIVGERKLTDNTAPVIQVQSSIATPTPGQINSEFTRKYLGSQGFSDDDIDELYHAVKYNENEVKTKNPTNYQEYKESSQGLMTDTPILPLTIMPDLDKITLENRRYLRPAEAWRLLGAEKAPLWSKKDGTRYIPWPKFGSYGKIYGKHLCQINDVEAVKAKNT